MQNFPIKFGKKYRNIQLPVLGESTSELVPVGLETDSDGNLYTSIYTDGSEWNGIWKVDPK